MSDQNVFVIISNKDKNKKSNDFIISIHRGIGKIA